MSSKIIFFLKKNKHFKFKTLLAGLICFVKLKTETFKHIEFFWIF
jgi:hypothetical protein